MRFSVAPLPGDSTFVQWHDAMMMCARLPGGIPQEFRRRLWLTLSEKHLQARGVDWSHAQRFCFNEWSNPDDDELGDQIVKDLHRTGCSLFCGEEAEDNQAMLKRVLLAYARWNKGVGYCQGFNMLAAIILEVMERQESDALKVMIYLIEGVLPESYFANNLRGLSVDMAVFRDLLRLRLPHLSRHLEHLQHDAADLATGTCYEPPLTNVFTMQWFLTLFSNCLPREIVMRVWDLTFLHGNEVLLRTALAIWDGLAARILEVHSADEFYTVMGALTRDMLTLGVIDANKLVQTVVGMAPFPFPGLAELRDKYTYNITPWTQSVSSVAKRGLRLFYSDDDDDDDESDDNEDDDQKIAVATAFGLSGIFRKSIESSRGPSPVSGGAAVSPSAFPPLGIPSSRHSHDSPRELSRPNLDISALKKQYARLRERQKQAHIILTSSQLRVGGGVVGSGHKSTPLTMNHLLRGKKALTSKTRRVVPQGVIPVIKPKKKAERKLSEPLWTRKSQQPAQTKQPLVPATPSASAGGGPRVPNQNLKQPPGSSSDVPPKVETLHWKDTPRRDRRASLPSGVKLLEGPTFSSGALGVPDEMDDDGGSSTSTELCDDEEEDKLSDLEPDTASEPRPATTSPRLETVLENGKASEEPESHLHEQEEINKEQKDVLPSKTVTDTALETHPEKEPPTAPLPLDSAAVVVALDEVPANTVSVESQDNKEVSECVQESKDAPLWTYQPSPETQATFSIPLEDLLAGKSLTAAEIIARIPFPSDVSFMKEESEKPENMKNTLELSEADSTDPFSTLHNVTPEKSPVDSPIPRFPSPIPEKESSLIVGPTPTVSPSKSQSSHSQSPSPKGSPFISPEKSPAKSPSLSPVTASSHSGPPLWCLSKLPPVTSSESTQDVHYTPPRSPKITLEDEKSNIFEIHSGLPPLVQSFKVLKDENGISLPESPTNGALTFEIGGSQILPRSSLKDQADTPSSALFSDDEASKQTHQETLNGQTHSFSLDEGEISDYSSVLNHIDVPLSAPYTSTSRFSSLFSELQEAKKAEGIEDETKLFDFQNDFKIINTESTSGKSPVLEEEYSEAISKTDTWFPSLASTMEDSVFFTDSKTSETSAPQSPEVLPAFPEMAPATTMQTGSEFPLSDVVYNNTAIYNALTMGTDSAQASKELEILAAKSERESSTKVADTITPEKELANGLATDNDKDFSSFIHKDTKEDMNVDEDISISSVLTLNTSNLQTSISTDNVIKTEISPTGECSPWAKYLSRVSEDKNTDETETVLHSQEEDLIDYSLYQKASEIADLNQKQLSIEERSLAFLDRERVSSIDEELMNSESLDNELAKMSRKPLLSNISSSSLPEKESGSLSLYDSVHEESKLQTVNEPAAVAKPLFSFLTPDVKSAISLPVEKDDGTSRSFSLDDFNVDVNTYKSDFQDVHETLSSEKTAALKNQLLFDTTEELPSSENIETSVETKSPTFCDKKDSVLSYMNKDDTVLISSPSMETKETYLVYKTKGTPEGTPPSVIIEETMMSQKDSDSCGDLATDLEGKPDSPSIKDTNNLVSELSKETFSLSFPVDSLTDSEQDQISVVLGTTRSDISKESEDIKEPAMTYKSTGTPGQSQGGANESSPSLEGKLLGDLAVDLSHIRKESSTSLSPENVNISLDEQKIFSLTTSESASSPTHTDASSPLKNGKKSPSLDLSFGRASPVITLREGESLSTSLEGRLSSLAIGPSLEHDDNKTEACSKEDNDDDKILEESETDLFNGKDLSSEAIRQRLWRGVKSLSLDCDVTLDPDVFCFLIKHCSKKAGAGKKSMGKRRNSEVELQELVKENTEIIERILKQKSLEDSRIYCISEGDGAVRDFLDRSEKSDDQKSPLKTANTTALNSHSPSSDHMASLQLSKAVSSEFCSGMAASSPTGENGKEGKKGGTSPAKSYRCSSSSPMQPKFSYSSNESEISVKSCGITKSFTKPSKLSRSSSVNLDNPTRPITFNPFPTRNINKPPKEVAVKLGLYSPSKTPGSSPT
ncbi:uncharacterized protein [Macrobrachium rosenbergii]